MFQNDVCSNSGWFEAGREEGQINQVLLSGFTWGLEPEEYGKPHTLRVTKSVESEKCRKGSRTETWPKRACYREASGTTYESVTSNRP